MLGLRDSWQVFGTFGVGGGNWLFPHVSRRPGGGLIIIDSMPDIRKRKPIPLVSDLVSLRPEHYPAWDTVLGSPGFEAARFQR